MELGKVNKDMWNVEIRAIFLDNYNKPVEFPGWNVKLIFKENTRVFLVFGILLLQKVGKLQWAKEGSMSSRLIFGSQPGSPGLNGGKSRTQQKGPFGQNLRNSFQDNVSIPLSRPQTARWVIKSSDTAP